MAGNEAADAAVAERAEVSDQQVSFESLFTLPFALHLRPLPHISYLAEPDSGHSSEQDDRLDDSDASSQGSNYRAGTHKLTPETSSVPPHSLKNISMLLDRTGCLDAVSEWSELLEMLDKADDDPHFANLRAFFDARFDRAGRLVGAEESGNSWRRLQRNPSKRKPTSSTLRSPIAGSPPRQSGSNSLTMLNRRRSSRHTSHDEDGEEAWSEGSGSRMRAPEIIVVAKTADEESTRVPFRIRLDLHRIGLAPEPPKPPPTARQSMRASLHRRLGSSPTKRAMAEGNDLQRVLSTSSSSDHSHAENLSLHPVASPDSFRSRPFSDNSDEYPAGRRGSDALSAISMGKSRTTKKASRSSTNSTAVTASITSEFGTSPPGSSDGIQRSRAGLFGSFSNNSKNPDGARRPSMIQRLMDFKGIRSIQTSRSKDSFSSQSNERSIDDRLAGMGLSRVLSPEAGGTAANFAASAADRARSHTNVSDLSNEDALDLADEEGSNTSASHILLGKRRTSSSAGPHSMLGFTPAPGMLPVEEGAAVASGAEGTGAVQLGQEAGAGSDFLALLRSAANTSLTLRPGEMRKVASPTRTPRGIRSAGGASTRSQSDLGARSPPGSVEFEEQERVDTLLAPFRQADPSWWLSGAVDPLPVSIACALSQALGWNGVMDLCYGKESRSARAGVFQPLGRAAEMERKMDAEKKRVENWAQGVAVGGDGAAAPSVSPTVGRTTDTSSLEDSEVRSKLAAMNLSTEAGSDVVAPSESASRGQYKAADNVGKISTWLRKKSGGLNMATDGSSSPHEQLRPLQGLGLKAGGENAAPMFTSPFTHDSSSSRSWHDWAELARSIASWLQEYETTRVRNGMAGEIGHEIESGSASKPATDVLQTNFDSVTAKMRYSSQASYQVPYCVVKDALNKHNSFRRRHGIPEGLPAGPDGREMGDYRWARKRLSVNHFATSTTLAANSLAFCMQQLATSDWTYNSAWELDYLEMCVFKNPIMAKRFPSPGSAIVPAEQTFRPAHDDQAQRGRAKPCPYPSADGEWSSSVWLQWLRSVRDGVVIVPAVSWQAWWTLIAVLNGGDGSDRALDVQLKAEEEPFSDLNDAEAVYL